jgi:CheY-like chemotaxis protein
LEPFTFDLFVGELRSALHYLYEPDQLRRSPLAAFLGVASSFDAAAALQRILLDAVESLQPSPDEPPQSRAWRIYDALVYRYVRRFDRDVVADQLGISGRQFRREQRAALEALATQLWGQFHLGDGAGDAAGATTSPGAQAESGQDTASQPAWLRDLPPEKPAELRHVLQAVLDLTRSLAKQRAVRLTVPLPDDLPEVSVPQVALRHALLNLLGVAMTCAAGGELVISVTLSDDEVEIEMAQGAGPQAGALALTEREVASLDVARGLAALAGGRLRLRPAGEPFGATLILPIIERIPVLVVEDNADTLQLFERYASGTRYCLTCTHEPRHALRLAREIDAQIIVLDVMMPEVDGWEILAQLRAGEDTAGSAVIVCTVLPQESLALGLGADAFLQKPVSREDFLAALDRQASILLAA